jgi:hypothetical protein
LDNISYIHTSYSLFDFIMFGAASRSLSSNTIVQAAMPALVKRLTRRATLRHLLNIKAQKEKHGDHFKFLEKHKRYPGLPGFVERPPMPPLDLGAKTDADFQYAITQDEIDYIFKSLPLTVNFFFF